MADLTFIDADYLNYLAAEDARLDPTGTSTPRLDALHPQWGSKLKKRNDKNYRLGYPYRDSSGPTSSTCKKHLYLSDSLQH